MFDATPLLRLYANRRTQQLDHQNAEETQQRQLLALVRQAAQTKFGKSHRFDSIRSVSDYQERVPLRSYDHMWAEYWKESFPRLDNCSWPGLIPYFAVSSGTSSGTTKYIPYTEQMTRSNTKAGLDLLTHHLRNCPQSRIFGGRSFILGGSTDLVEQAPGIWSGDLSGIAVKTLPWWARARYFPPAQLALLKNWEEKIALLSKHSLQAQIRMISGVPSWMLIFFDHLSQLLPQSAGKISGMYPELELLVHGGVNFAPYRKRFESLLEGSRAETREVYPASEGFIAVADRAYGEGLRMVLDHGIFFEFVPVEELQAPEPTRLWAANVECNVNYALLMTTCAGLWSYVIGDTVKVIERQPLRVLVSGRTAYYLSAFGEHIIAEELEDAVATAAEAIRIPVSDYVVGPVYPEQSGELGGHLYVVEFSGRTPDPAELRTFTKALDQRLCQRNEDYEAHRAKGFGLREPQILIAKPGMFAAWMKSRGKLGGQNKVPRIIMDRDLFSHVRTYAEGYR